MSIIYSYPEQGVLNADDMLIGTSAQKVGGKQKNITRNFSIQQIADFINGGTGFIDPVATDFQIPVFNQLGKKITGSIMSQDSSPSNGVAGTGITITGNLTTTGNLIVPGVVTLGSGINITTILGPVQIASTLIDNAGTTSAGSQILLSNPNGTVTWSDYSAGLTYQGVWNATANTPTLVSGTGTNGHFYIVDVAGNTILNGNTDWQIGDWALFSGVSGAGGFWDKIDNTQSLTGTGTANTVAMWTSSSIIGDSLISQAGTVVSVDASLKVKDTIEATTTNANLKLKGAGTGGVEVMGDTASATDGRIQLNCYVNTHGVTIQSPPHSDSATYTLILPANVGNANQVLTSAGAGAGAQLTWSTPATGTVTSINYTTDFTAFTAGPAAAITTTGTFTLNKNGGTTGQYIDGAAGAWTNLPSSDTYDLGSGVSGVSNSIELKLTSGSGTDNSAVTLTGGTGITVVQTGDVVTLTGTAQGVTGSGTATKLPKFATSTSLDDSIMSQSTSGGYPGNGLLLIDNNPGQPLGAMLFAGPTSYPASTPINLATISAADRNRIRFEFDQTAAGITQADAFRTAIGWPAAGVTTTATAIGPFTIAFNNGASIIITQPAGALQTNTNTVGASSIPVVEIGNNAAATGNNPTYGTGSGTVTPYSNWPTQPPAGTGNYGNAAGSVNGIQIAGELNMTTNQIKNVVNPTIAQDAATKIYVDTEITTALSGALIFKGTFNAATGAIDGGSTFLYQVNGAGAFDPSLARVAVAVGDFYIANVAGNFYGTGGTAMGVGDEAIATTAYAANASVLAGWSVVPTQSSGGTVTSVGYTTDMPAFVVGGQPITSSGVLTLNKTGGAAGQFLQQDGNWADVPAGYNPWQLSAQSGTAQSIGSGETVTITSANTAITTAAAATNTLTLTSTAFGGNAIIGHVPSAAGGTDNTKFLKGDGTWAEAASTGGSQIDVYTTPSIGTPNGTIKTFGTLGSTNIDNISQTEVYIDGVYQSTSTYNVSNSSGTTQAGTYITFITAPPTGVNIEIRVVQNIIYTNIITQSFTIPTYVAGNLTAVPFGLYIFTQATSRNLILPANPVAGTSFKVSLRYASGATTPINKIVRNATNPTDKIMGVDADLNLDTLPASFEVIWTGIPVASTTFQGWVIVGAGS